MTDNLSYFANDGMEDKTEESRTQHLRHLILSGLGPYESPGPLMAGTVYVWPTKFCNVGCEHCNFSSPSITGAKGSHDAFHTTEAQTRLIQFVNQLGVWKAVLSGGGEPLLEPIMVERFIESVYSERLEEIEVITSGVWAKTPTTAKKVLNRLVDAYRRRSHPYRAKFSLRLSVDWFHQRAIGLTPIENIIRALDSADFAEG